MTSAHSAIRSIRVFSLPSQTWLMFSLIPTVLLGSVILGSIGRAPLVIWPIAIGLAFLPLRAFLAQRAHLIRGLEPRMPSAEFPNLQRELDRLTVMIGLARVPELLVTGRTITDVHTFGSPRRWHIALSLEQARRWDADLKIPERAVVVQAQLIHELYHFRTGDYWQLGYIDALFRVTIGFVGWVAVFLAGLGFLLLLALQDFITFDPATLLARMGVLPPAVQTALLLLFPSAEALAAVRESAQDINFGLVLQFILSALLPFVLIAGLLQLVYRPLLWRIREHYADCGVVLTQKSILPFCEALLGVSFAGSPQYLADYLAESREKVLQIGYRLTEFFCFHPHPAGRVLVAAEPELIYGGWLTTSVIAGSLVLILDILLASPLTLIHISSWPIHFTILALALVITFNYIIPSVALGKAVWPSMITDLAKIVAVVVGIRFVWLLINLGMLLVLVIAAPATLQTVLQTSVAVIARYAGAEALPFFDNLGEFLVQAIAQNLAQVLLIFTGLFAILTSLAFIISRIFTWYRLPRSEKTLLPLVNIVIAVHLAFFGGAVLPVATMILLGSNTWSWATASLLLVGLICAVGGFVWFRTAERKYSRVCPVCGAEVPGWFSPGKECREHHTQFEWMVV